MTLPSSLKRKEMVEEEKPIPGLPSSMRQKEKKQPKESKLKSILRTGFQPISGYLKKFTYPADILQMAGIGEALDPLFIDELRSIHEREGLDFDENEYRKKVAEAAKAFPTQSNIERGLEESTGLPLQAKTGLQKAFNLGGMAGGFQAGNLAQKGIAAVTAPVVSEIAQSAGVPEPIAELLGLTSGGSAASNKLAAKLGEKALSSEQQALRQVAEKHNLPTYAGMEVETPKISPVVSAQKQEKLAKELAEKSEKAIDEVITKQLPLNEVEKLGINPESVYERSYKRMDETAKEVDKQISSGEKQPINVDPVLKWIKNEENKIYASAPSLSAPDKTRLRILQQEYNQLTKKPPKSFLSKLKLGPKRERVSKTANASQIIDQTRNFNENVKGIYRKPEFTGAENEAREVYGQLNEQFQKLLEKSGESDLARQLWFGNQVFHETTKVNQVQNILSPAFEHGYNSNKMASIVRNKSNKKFLERSMGKDSVKDLVDIAHYGNQAEKLVFKRLQNPKTIGEYVSNLTPLKAGLLFLKHASVPGLAMLGETTKGTSQRVAGLLFTRPTTRKAYVNFLKGAMSPQKASFKNASKSLTEAIDKEFGNEENLLKIASRESDEKASSLRRK
jgi:hypothetical protein